MASAYIFLLLMPKLNLKGGTKMKILIDINKQEMSQPQDGEEDQDLGYPGRGPVQGMGKGTPPRGWGQPKALPLLTAL